jgi:hypothetical protein
MEKVSTPGDDDGSIHSVETYILERIFADRKSEDSTTDIRYLMESMDNKTSPLFDQSIEDLISQGLIQSSDGENYQITFEGINELENRKNEAIPL